MRISHEAIYQALFVHSRGALKRELVACLRAGRVAGSSVQGPPAGWWSRDARGDDQRAAR